MSSRHYVWMRARQEPFAYAVDDAKRTLFSMNFDARAYGPNMTIEEDVAMMIVEAGLGVLASSLFLGPSFEVASGNGPFIQVIATSGMASTNTHDDRRYQNLTFQIVVRGKPYVATKERAYAIWQLLDNNYNFAPGDQIFTEEGDRLTTEGGDTILQEEAP